MFLRRSLASLARQLHVYDLFLCRYILGACPLPPPPIPKSWLRYCCQLSLKSGQNEDGRFRPPHSLHEIAATGHRYRLNSEFCKDFAFVAFSSTR